MRHYVLTRSAYAPDYPLEANVRRLELLQFVTVPALAAQTSRLWNWLVRLDADDPLLRLRQAAIRSAAPNARFVYRRDAWRDVIHWGPTILQTRLDDDDALAPDFIARVQSASARCPDERVAWMLPVGWKVEGRRADPWIRRSNQFVTLQTPPGDEAGVFDVEHAHMARLAPIRVIDEEPAWVWIRHPDVLGGHRTASGELDGARALVPSIDWRIVAECDTRTAASANSHSSMPPMLRS